MPHGILELGSKLVHAMVRCLTAPSHYLNQYWLTISEVLCHSPQDNFTRKAQDISMVSCRKGPTRPAYAWQIGPFWQDTLDLSLRWVWKLTITATSPMDQWVRVAPVYHYVAIPWVMFHEIIKFHFVPPGSWGWNISRELDQCHCSWCPGSLCRQVISSPGIE